MIKASDVAFHTPAQVPYDWAETNYFSIYIPEANLTAWIYTIARAGVGAFVCDIEAIDRIQQYSLQSRYCDFQQHLPMPEKFQDYTLVNGLTVKTSNEPYDYHIDYVGLHDTELHLVARGIMEPFDITDRSMDPKASADPTQSGFGAAYANHFDMTVHFTGTAKFHGVRYNVDCISTMDHSWGPRNERGLKPMGWINGNFGRDFAFHAIWVFDQFKHDWQQFELAHGYVLWEGEVRGLTHGRIRAARGGRPFPTGYEMVLTDRHGRDYPMTGVVVNQTPWACYSNIMGIVSTVRWYHHGREGYGLAQENWPLDRLAGRWPG